MNRLRSLLKLAIYPLFYLAALGVFSYLVFPWDKLKERLIAEYQNRQKPSVRGGQATRLEIGSLRPYFFTGIELRDVKLIYPPEPGPAKDDAKDAPKETVVSIDRATVRLRLLPLLLLRARLGVHVEAFGGTVDGVVPVGTSSGGVDLHMAGVELAQIGLVERELGLPVGGTLSGDIQITPQEGVFTKANGTVSLSVADLTAGDGKTKIKGQILLPSAHVGTLELQATAEAGVLKIDKFAATGPHVELVGDGKISVREPPGDSALDLLVRFKFTDAYKSSSDAAKGLLGAPGQTSPPPMIELQEPRMKRAKRSDGFYGWRITGPIKNMKFEPSTADSVAGAPKVGKSKADSPFTPPKSKRPTKRPDATDSDGDGDSAPGPAERPDRGDRPTGGGRPGRPGRQMDPGGEQPVPAQPIPAQPEAQPQPEPEPAPAPAPEQAPPPE